MLLYLKEEQIRKELYYLAVLEKNKKKTYCILMKYRHVAARREAWLCGWLEYIRWAWSILGAQWCGIV
jgi:hypothetical protein